MNFLPLIVIVIICVSQVTTFHYSCLAHKTASSKKHFVLVHGVSHGAWSWYKLTALLERAGHDVTAMDLAGGGISPKQLDDVVSVQDWIEPLMKVMQAIPDGDKVVLVGHSCGGLALTLAMEAFPEKISLAVFIAAQLVPSNSTLSDLYSQLPKKKSGPMYDTKYIYDDDGNATAMLFGSQMLAHRIYNKCPLEDLKLATVLLREMRIFNMKYTADVRFTRERYGSMPRVYAFCEKDKLFDKDAQQSMIDKAGVNEVKVIKGADHMAMLSKPHEVFSYLLEIAEKYA